MLQNCFIYLCCLLCLTEWQPNSWQICYRGNHAAGSSFLKRQQTASSLSTIFDICGFESILHISSQMVWYRNYLFSNAHLLPPLYNNEENNWQVYWSKKANHRVQWQQGGLLRLYTVDIEFGQIIVDWILNFVEKARAYNACMKRWCDNI